MSKRLLIRVIVGLVLLAGVAATADAGFFFGVRARGDYQILSYDPGVVRAWVVNGGCFNQQALVGVVANVGSSVTKVDGTVFVPAKDYRFVDVAFSGAIDSVNRIIVTPLGTVGPRRCGCF